ncbi:MAG TPA: zf-HC2 domain-containing protein [Bryobacteraceae bacterium]|nr:zf-HC2 domain-containing protein [Bryobacteraceae bacterium]
MSCSPFDLKDYFLKELPDSERRQVEAHVGNCRPCREELDRLRLTEAALFALREEEIPRRIAFVSDKVFEPSPWRRWWAAFWGSTARLAFASAAMLSIAILVSALRPVGQIAVRPNAPQVANAVSDTEIQSRIDTAVAKAVAQVDARQTGKTKQLVADLEGTRKRLLWAADEFDYYQKRVNTVRVLADYGPPRADNGELK